MTRRWTAVFGLACMVAATAPAVAQDSGRVLVDRIVAIVGLVPIPLSRVQEELLVYRQQGGQIPEDPRELEQLRRDILRRVVEQELIIQAAQRDTSIRVTDEEVQAAADEGLRNIRQQFASELEYQRGLQAAGFASADDYRLWYSEQKRRELLNSKLLQELRARGELRPIPPTEAEIREYYEGLRDQRPERPATVSLRQIVVAAEPDSVALRTAFDRADSIAKALRDDADFAVLARRFSDDVGSRERGGELGWFRRGQMVREFEETAFRLRPGTISNPVLTPFGFHVIEVLRSEPASIQARHILIKPFVSDSGVAAAELRADSVRAELAAGAPYDSLARVYHDRSEGDRIVEDVPRENLPAAYRDLLALAEPGDILGPVEFEGSGARTKFAIVILDEARAPGPATYEDLRDQIRSNLAEERAYTKFLESLRHATYVDIRF